MRQTMRVLAVAAALALTGSALADGSAPNLYGGLLGSHSLFQNKGSGSVRPPGATETFSYSGEVPGHIRSLGAFAGYRFNSWLAAELGVEYGMERKFQFSEVEGSDTYNPRVDSDWRVKTKSWSVPLTLMVLRPIDDRADFYARTGMHWWSSKDEWTIRDEALPKNPDGSDRTFPGSDSEDGFGFLLGVGTQYRVFSRASLGIEYQLKQYDEDDFGADWVHGLQARLVFH